jgi:hypothetical protein
MTPIYFLLPLAFVAAPLLAYLNYLPYRSHKDVKTVPVTTLFLLRQFIVEPQKQARRVPPLRYFIELFLIATALLLISGPYLRDADKKVAILLDDSFSTFANGKNGSIFSEMKKETLNLRRGFSKVYDTFTTSTFPEPADALENLLPTYTRDNIDNTVQRLLSNPKYERVVILTDKNVPADVPKNVSVRSFNNYKTKENVAISRVRYDSKNKRLSLDCRSFSRLATTVNIRVFDILKKEQIFLEQRKLPPQSTTLVNVGPLTLDQSQVTDGLFKVDITPLDTNDAIAEDNLALFSSRSDVPRIRVHSDLSLERLGLARIPTYRFEASENKPENIEATQTDVIGDIFHKQTPPSDIQRNTLIINPASGYFGQTSNPGGAPITFIKLDHTITKYLELKNETLPPHSTFVLPQDAFAVLRSTFGPVIWTKTQASNDHILTVSGLELLPFSGKNSPTSSVLLLNLLDYTFSPDALSETNATKILKNARKYESFDFVNLEGISEKNVTPDLINSLGFIRYKLPNMKANLKTLAFFAESESNVSQPKTLNFSNISSSKEKEAIKESPLSELFYLIVTILMILILIGDAILFYGRRFNNA